MVNSYSNILKAYCKALLSHQVWNESNNRRREDENMDVIETPEFLEEVHAKREAGFNCAEGVFWGVTQSVDMDLPVSCVTGFGGGIGDTGSVCGALTGAIAAVGAYFGRIEPGENEKKRECNSICATIVDGFQQEMGTELCREILGHLPGERPATGKVGINPKCKQAVTVAFRLALEQIEQRN